VLAGLDHVDTIFTEFVAALDATIRHGRSGWLHRLVLAAIDMWLTKGYIQWNYGKGPPTWFLPSLRAHTRPACSPTSYSGIFSPPL
jgi:hypothetical protein